MAFLRNAWYVAAWSAELAPGGMAHRKILGEPVLLLRDSTGTPAAIGDRCPHRFAPLHRGRLDGDTVECGYHGLRFDRTGQCVHNPHGPTPRAARVPSYPLVERYSALWVWMGDPARADPAAIPEFDFLVPEAWHVGTGHMLVQAHYELESDNILDLSHIEFMHPLFSSEAVRAGKLESSVEGETVWSRRFITGDRPPEFIMSAFGIPPGRPVDRWLDVRWDAPALMALWTGGVVSGEPRSAGRETPTAHLFTPETHSSTHYFYAIGFPRALGAAGADMAREHVELLRRPFELEDKPMIEAVARNMEGAEFWSLQPLLLAIDTPAVRARRILARKIEAEQAAA